MDSGFRWNDKDDGVFRHFHDQQKLDGDDSVGWSRNMMKFRSDKLHKADSDWGRYWGWLPLVVLCVVLYGSGITRLPPVDRDEARFAQASRQMLETRDFVRIRFQDVPRHKKPIGIHWLQAASAATFGPADHRPIWPYRLPSLLGALLAVVSTAFCGSVLFDRSTGLLAGLLLGSCLLLAMEAHLATTDAMLLATVVAAQSALGFCYLQTQRGEPVATGTVVTFWVAQGVGWLLKGPVITLVCGLTVGALCLADRRIRWLKALRFSWGPILMVALLCPWAFAIQKATQGTFFQDAVRNDLLPKLLGGQESHGFPPGYFLLLMPLTFWPASLFSGLALHQAWKYRGAAAVRFCLAWCLPTWLAFELIPTKLPHYILPAYPALALLAARAVSLLTEGGAVPITSRWLRLGALAWGAMSAILGAAIVALPWRLTGQFQPLALLAAAAAVVSPAVAIRYVWLGRFQMAARLVIVGPLLTLVLLFQGILPSLDPLWLSRGISQAVSHRLAPKGSYTPVVAAGYHEPSLVFLLGTDTKLLSAEEAACYLREHPEALAVVSNEAEPVFQQKLTDLGQVVEGVDTIRGFNYTKGRWQTIRLYVLGNPHGR